MSDILLTANDPMVYVYEYMPDSMMGNPIKLKKRTFTEAYQEYLMVYNAYYDAKKKVEEAYADYRQKCALLKTSGCKDEQCKDVIVKAHAHYEMCYKMRNLWATGLAGAEGMLEYYTALEVAKAVNTVLSMFKGKKAGPKTSRHFWEGVSECIPLLGVVAYPHGYQCMSIVMPNGHGVELSYNEPLTDEENKYVDKTTWHVFIPNKQFEGKFPTDWYLYAQHIEAVNQLLNDKFNEFLTFQTELTRSLKIGDVKMAHVSPVAQREE